MTLSSKSRSGLSPEGEGVLRALGSLKRVRHFDAVALQLVQAGFATIASGVLTITPKGQDHVAAAR